MEDYPVSHGRPGPDAGPRASTPLIGEGDLTSTSEDVAPSGADVEVESLRRRLALYEKERDAIHERAAAIQRMSERAAELVRHEAEAKAQEIILRAAAEADLLELRARVQAEEMRVREVAQVWSRMDSALEKIEVGSSTTGPDLSAPAPTNDGEQQTTGSTGLAETATDERTNESDDPQAVADDQCEMAGEHGVTEAESGPDATTQPPLDVRRYRIEEPLTSESVTIMEQAVGQISGVVAAEMSLSPDGARILTVFSHDPRSTELAIKQLRL